MPAQIIDNFIRVEIIDYPEDHFPEKVQQALMHLNVDVSLFLPGNRNPDGDIYYILHELVLKRLRSIGRESVADEYLRHINLKETRGGRNTWLRIKRTSCRRVMI